MENQKSYTYIAIMFGLHVTSTTLASNPNLEETPIMVESQGALVLPTKDSVPTEGNTSPESISFQANPMIKINGVPVLTSAEDPVGGLYVKTPAADFRPDGHGESELFYSFSNGVWQGGGLGGCLMAPANIPDKATISSVSFQIYDNSGDNDIRGSLWRKDAYNMDNSQTLYFVSSSGASNFSYILWDLSNANPDWDVVNDFEYNYFYTICLPDSDTRLLGARVYYTVD